MSVHSAGARRISGAPLPHPVVGFAAFCLAVFALGHAAVWLAADGAEVAPWWPAAGVSVGALSVVRRWRWQLGAAVVVFSALANITGGRSVAIAVAFGFANAAEALVASWYLNRGGGDRPALDGLADVWRLGVAAVLGGLTIGVAAAATVEIFGEAAGGAAFVAVVPSHVAAIVLIVPLVLAGAPVRPPRRLEVALNWMLSIAVTAVVFAPGQAMPLAFVALSPMVWSGVRLGVRHVARQLFVVGVTVTVLTVRGVGPFAEAPDPAWSPSELVQTFVIVGTAVLLPMAVAMAERELALARAIASEERFRRGFRDSLVGMLLLRVEPDALRVVETNAAAQQKLGVGPGDVVPDTLRDDDGTSLSASASNLAPGEGWRSEMTYVGESGAPRRYNVSLTRLSGAGSDTLATCHVVDVTASYLAEQELARQALQDDLTGLPNRSSFNRRLRQELDRVDNDAASVAVMYLDVDDFKLVNDAYGHQAGDQLLTVLAKRITTVIRPQDMVARMGGDEFAVICPGISDPSVAHSLAERLVALANEPVTVDGRAYLVGMSVGWTVGDEHATAGRLLAEADLALYAAKAAGKGSIEAYSRDLGVRAETRVRVEAGLRRARDNFDFEMFMQPVIRLDTNEIEAAEALIRWRDADAGFVPPGQWLDIAERAGMMAELGAWILDESCRQAAAWQPRSATPPRVHVNVSARQLDSPGFAPLVLDTLDRHGLEPGRLVLELTETQLAQVQDFLVAELEVLAELGVTVAADDFGTGYSPLTRLTELPIGMIKIDKQFIDALTSDDRSFALVASLIDLASTLRVETVAEGIEHERQAELLRSLGCDAAQGHLWYPALPSDAFRTLLAGSKECELGPDRERAASER